MLDLPTVIAATERTTIRKISLADAPFMFDLMRTPGWIKYIGDRNLTSVAAVEGYIDKAFLKVYQEHGYGYYLVQNLAGDSIGVAGFLKKPYLDNEDYGFAFMPAYYHQGFAHEVSEALLEYGQKTFGFQILDAVTLPNNSASRKLLEKLGFIKSGMMVLPDEHQEILLYRWYAN